MDISGIDKIKINNAIVVFIVIIHCICFPIVFLLAINYRYFFQSDLLKIVSAALCVGCTNFAIVYSYTAVLYAFPSSIHVVANLNPYFQRPIIITLILLTMVYIVVLIEIEPNNFKGAIQNIGIGDAIMFGVQVVTVVEAAIKRRIAAKKLVLMNENKSS